MTMLKAAIAGTIAKSTTTSVSTIIKPMKITLSTGGGNGGRRNNSNSNSNGISLILIINYLLLLLLSLCCVVCKSNAEHSAASLLTTSTFDNELQQQQQHANQLAAYASVGDAVASRVSIASAIIDKINLNSTKHGGGTVVQKNTIGGHAAADDGDNNIVVNTDKTIQNITNMCVSRCKDEEALFLDEFGIRCATGDLNEKCFVSRCVKGCQQWWHALQEFESCQETCSSLQFYPFDLPCIGACEMAQRNYWHLQRLAMEPLVRNTIPQLLLNESSSAAAAAAAEAITTLPTAMMMMSANSLTLQWPIKFPDKYLASRPFNIQYCYVRRRAIEDDGADGGDGAVKSENVVVATACAAETDWSNLADYNCNDNFNCDILDVLMPYTSYSFRFEFPFGENPADILYSPPTAAFTTPPEGAPLSSPIIRNLLALDDAHVAIFWKAGEFTNGPLTGYKLHLTNGNSNATVEQIVSATQEQFVATNLLPLTNYTIQLCMLNAEGVGPCAAAWIVTKDLPQVKGTDIVNEFILAGEYSIRLRTLDALADTQLIYLSDQLINDYAIDLAAKKLFVVDEVGHVFRANLEKSNEREALYLSKSVVDFRPAKITADWLNAKLYIAGQAPNKFWHIIRCDMLGGNIELLASAEHHSVQQLVLDPINGWLFWTQSQAAIQRMNLATLKHEAIIQKPSIGSFIVDLPRNLLIYYDREDQELYELSYDGTFKQKLKHGINSSNNNTSAALHGELQSFAVTTSGDIYATNGTHLAHQNYRTNENDIWFIRELEWCWSFMPHQQRQLQPIPQPTESPQAVQALLTANMAKISWQPPALHALQTAYAWQHWEYELELMDVASNSAFNIRNIKTTYFDVEQLQADNAYKVRVRAVSKTGASAWSPELLTRTWPLGKHTFLWATTRGFYETNEVGEEVRLLLDGSTAVAEVLEMHTFVQLNGSIFFVANQTLQCINLMNPELSCALQLGIKDAKVGTVAYDWRGGKIYLTDTQRNLLLRANLDGADKELLPVFEAQQIEIDSYSGHIYYSTGARLARRTLSGSGSYGRQEVQYFHVNGIGGVVLGFALDMARQQIYWVARQNEGHVRLFKAATERGELLKFEDILLKEDVVAGSLAYVEEIDSLLWLAEARNATRLVIARTDNLAQQAHLDVPQFERVRAVKLRRDYTSYLDTSVIPVAIAADSIRVDEEGYWDDFNVKWAPTTTADNYTVFYKVLLQYSDDAAQLTRFFTLEVNDPMLRLTEFHQPRLWLNISITPHTYWRAGATAVAQLRTPAAAPTQPKRLRVFISHTTDPLLLTPNISALIRWDPPENISMNTAVAYKVYCWLGDELYRERLHNNSGSDKPLEARIGELTVGETYTFQVQAFVVGRASGGEKTAQHAVHISPEVQSVPTLLVATSEFIAEFDLDLNRRRTVVHTPSEVEHFTLMQGEQRLLWVNENVELLTFVPGSATVKLARMRAEVLALTADWVTRTVYWAELDADLEAVSIYKLELCQFEGRVMMGTKIFRTARGRLLRDMLVLPFSQTLLWLEYDAGGHNATLLGRNLTDGASLKFKGATALLRMFEGSLGAEIETVNLLDHKGKVCKYDVQRLICNPLKLQFDVAQFPERVVHVERDNGYIYALQNGSIRAYNRRKQNLEYELEAFDVRRIKAHNYQEYPPRRCLLPSENEKLLSRADILEPQVTTLEEEFFTLELPVLNIDDTCWLPVPGVRFAINVTDNAEYQRNLTVYERTVNITDLNAFTNYTVQLEVYTYYQQKLGLVAPKIPDFIVRTAAGTPTAPQNFTAYALSPTEIHVHWRQPAELNNAKVWYELHWQMENSSLGAYKKVEGTSVILTNMTPAQRYALWLKVFSTRAKFEVTSSLVVETFEQPPDLQLLSRGPENLTLHWLQPIDVSSTLLVCHQVNAEDNEFSIDITNKSEQVVITELEPKTKYEFHLELYYPHVPRPYQLPERFIFETLGDHPSSPGKPQIEHIAGEIFKVSWDPARQNGSPITEYSLEALQSIQMMAKKRKRRSPTDAEGADEMVVVAAINETVNSPALSELPWAEELQPLEDKWLVYCNTTELSCIVRDLYTMRLLMFRVRARNEAYGWGPYSEDSERVLEPFVTPEKRDSLVFAIIAPAAIVSSCVLMLLVIRIVQRRRMRAKKLLEKSRPSIWSNFSTLQQQQLISSRNRAFSVASHSTLYTGGPLSDADIALLPHINWNQITLQNFLGSGAFGEVYEGLVKHEDEEEQQKVAIKTLRKGANEFAELLQEAQLMSNFKHENIVRLIGVCFDTESISIIMEHMEAGDLLSYLRESRPNTLRPNSSLQLLDLMSMCIDVATGCSYLEDMHFVHRDLACRNCLVSSRDRSKRVVKIGDFGLARDIYKNDYYRKEGEGLLPVRWMAPESLVDGVFTNQSDVWAFAVLCWEILTLGQQPYAARNNLDVLNYVKAGGRLEQPDNCPDKFYTLMLQCWLSDPEERPSFRKCLNILLAIKTDVRRVSMGYTKDDDVYATYVNNQGIVLSTFLANPLPKLDEEEDDVGGGGGDANAVVDIVTIDNGRNDAVVVGTNTMQNIATAIADIANEKTSMKVRFQTSISKEESSEGSVNDESKLIKQKSTKDKDEVPNYYINEAISRL